MHACIVSHFSCVWLFATLWTVAHQAPWSMGFCRKEYWSGLPCPSPSESESRSVVSDSLQPHGCPWNSLDQNTGVSSLSLLQGIFPTQESNPGLLHCRRILHQLSHKRDLPNPGIELASPVSPALTGGFFTTSSTWEAQLMHWCCCLAAVTSDSLRRWTAAHQASLSFTISQSLLKLMSIELMMSSNHLILCHPLILLPSVFSGIRVFSNELALHIQWPKYWSFSFSNSPSNEYSGLISFRIDWFDLLAVQGTLKSLIQHHSLKASIFGAQPSFWSNSYICTWLLEKPEL